jgi:hypothetical protein
MAKIERYGAAGVYDPPGYSQAPPLPVKRAVGTPINPYALK